MAVSGTRDEGRSVARTTYRYHAEAALPLALGATGARMGSQKVWDPTFLTLHLVFGIYPF